MELADIVRYGFMQRALIAGFFIAVVCSVLGVLLVLRRLSLIGDGLAHVTFGGVALSLALNQQPLYAAVPVVLLSSLGILKLIEKAKMYGDAAIGIVSSLGIAIGVIIANFAGGFNIDLFSYLFGSILSISQSEVITVILLSLSVLGVVAVFYNEIFLITFDEDFAKISGVNTGFINSLIVMLTGVTVVLTMKVVGIMLTSALMVLPAVTAFQLAKSFRSTVMISSVAGCTSVVLGILLSFVLNLPTGASIVILNFLFFVMAFIFRSYRYKEKA